MNDGHFFCGILLAYLVLGKEKYLLKYLTEKILGIILRLDTGQENKKGKPINRDNNEAELFRRFVKSYFILKLFVV